MRDLVARVAMALAVPATIVGVAALGGRDPAFRLASLAPLGWATAGLAAVLVLGHPRRAPGVRPARPAAELPKAA